MFTLVLLVLFTAFATSESQQISMEIKEVDIENTLKKTPELKECVELIKKEDLNNPEIIKEKRAKASECFKEKFNPDEISDKALKEISESLQLENFGFVKSNTTQDILHFLEERFDEALFGKPDKNQKGLGKAKLADHKIYTELYETQLGKNLLLTISNYCYNDLLINTDNPQKSDFFKNWKEHSNNVENIDKIDDQGYQDAPVKANLADIYQDLAQDLQNYGGENQSSFMNNIFGKCIQGAAKLLCEHYQKEVKENPQTKKGRKSCFTLEKIKNTKRTLMALQSDDGTIKRNEALNKNSVDFHVGDSLKSGDSSKGKLDELTTITSGDLAHKALKDFNAQGSMDEIDEARCSETPEDPKCAKYFFTQDQEVNFQNQAMLYDAQTEAEKARLAQIEDDEEFEKYLKDKSYFDLLEKFKQEGNRSAIIAEVSARYEAERKAVLSEIEDAFKKNQLQKDGNGEVVTDKKESLKAEKQRLTELILFNNFISGYLSTCNEDLDSNGNCLGEKKQNTASLLRELRSISNDETIDESSLQYFDNLENNLDSTQSESTSTLGVDQIDNLLNPSSETSN